MSRRELSDAEIDALRRRIAAAAGFHGLDAIEVEALDAVLVRLRRYGANLYLSNGERERLHRIFERAGVLTVR